MFAVISQMPQLFIAFASQVPSLFAKVAQDFTNCMWLGSVECFNLLVEHGANIQCGRMKIGQSEGEQLTPLQIAIATGNKDLVKALYGAEAEMTPMDINYARSQSMRVFLKYYS